MSFQLTNDVGYDQEYVMGALSGKTVLLVTHQVDFLPAFDSVLVSLFPITFAGFSNLST